MNCDEPNKKGDAHRSRALVRRRRWSRRKGLAIGLIAGLIEREIDLGDASLIVGTSAGAVVGRNWRLRRAFGAPPKIVAPPSIYSGSMVDLAIAMARAAQSAEPELIRAEIGKMALNAQTISEEASVSRSMFAPFVGQAWPNQFRATTVNARTGQLQVWDASSGAPLERAIAASTAAPCIWPPITINGERYIDGGVRSMLNADLAYRFDIVVAVSCFPLTARDKAGPAFFIGNECSPACRIRRGARQRGDLSL